jgi:GAF domain-containing protein
MNSPISNDDAGTGSATTDASSSAGPVAPDRIADLTGAHADPALIGLLDMLNGARSGEATEGWSVLTNSDRLRAVSNTGLLGGAGNPEVDQMIELTVEAVGIPFAALNLITDVEQLTAAIASRSAELGDERTRGLADCLCVYPVMSGTALIVDDMADHPALAEHSTARNGEVAAYIGIPLVTDSGEAVGTLCAWDTVPHHWSSGEVQILTDLAEVVRGIIFK